MATNLRLRRRLLAVAFVTSATAALAACTIEFIDNDDDDWVADGGDLDAGWAPDGWGGSLDAGGWPDAVDDVDGGSGGSIDAGGWYCGDGIVQGIEQCDNGVQGVNTATCDRDCTVAVGGDALANFPAGEQCDTGNASVSCDLDCTAVVCGDGLVNTVAGEQCDDGNAVDTDACHNDCTVN
jgi:cysteine-rich repeat protein